MNDNEKEKQKEKELEIEIGDFTAGIMPYGSSDIRSAISILIEYGVENAGDNLVELVEGYVDVTDVNLNDVDVCYVALEHILQTVRNHIDDYLKFDIVNDAGFYTYSNFLDSQFDYSENDQKMLQKAIDKTDKETLTRLLNEEFVADWLEDVGIAHKIDL